MVAIDNNYVDMVKFLWDYGANTDVEAEVTIVLNLANNKWTEAA